MEATRAQSGSDKRTISAAGRRGRVACHASHFALHVVTLTQPIDSVTLYDSFSITYNLLLISPIIAERNLE